MSLGIISEKQYKRVAQDDNVTLLDELAAPDAKNYANKYTYLENLSLTDATIDFTKSYTVEEDGVYLVRVKCAMVGGTGQTGLVISNSAKLYINNDLFDSVSSYYNWQWGYIEFVLPLKAGTVIKASYYCEQYASYIGGPNSYRCGFWVDKLGN